MIGHFDQVLQSGIKQGEGRQGVKIQGKAWKNQMYIVWNYFRIEDEDGYRFKRVVVKRNGFNITFASLTSSLQFSIAT